MRAFDSEYSALDENDNLVMAGGHLVGTVDEEQLGDDHFFTSLEALVEFGTGALVVVR